MRSAASAPATPSTAATTSTVAVEYGATPSETTIQTVHVTSSTPNGLANPSPAPGSRPNASAASGAAARPTTSTSAKKPSAWSTMRPQASR